MKHQALRAVRERWYEAYVAGNTNVLAQLEDPSFFAVGEAEIQTRVSRLDGIAAAVRTGRRFPAGSRTEDLRLDLHQINDDLVSARGTGRLSKPRGGNPTVLFTELWQRSEPGWRALHLHNHETAAPSHG